MNIAIVANKDGNPVPVKVIGGGSGGGGITGKDVETGDYINEVSFEVDDNGHPVLRVIDAAPFGYDPVLNATRTAAVAQRKVVKLSGSHTETVPVSGSFVLEIKPPAGKIWKIENLFFRYPAVSGATSGKHQVTVRQGENYSVLDILRGVTAFDKRLDFVYGSFSDSVDTKTPVSEDSQHRAIKGLHVSEEIPIYVVYQNQTDAPQTDSLEFHVFCTEEESL